MSQSCTAHQKQAHVLAFKQKIIVDGSQKRILSNQKTAKSKTQLHLARSESQKLILVCIAAQSLGGF